VPIPGPGVLGLLGRLVSLGRSARYGAARAEALFDASLLPRGSARGAPPRELARRARLWRLAGRAEEAAAAYAAVLERAPDLPEALAGRWELASARGGGDARDLDRAVAAAPRDPVWRAWRGLSLLERGRDGRADLRRAARARGPAGVLGLTGLALAELRDGRPRRALAPLDAAVRREPREGWLRRLRAKARFKSGDEAGFVADCDAENLLDEGIGTLGYAFGALAHDPERLARRLDREILRRPDEAWLRALRGDCRRSPEAGRSEDGRADLEEAARLAPRSAWIRGHLARARLAAGDSAGARAAADAAVRLAPACGWLRAWRGALKAQAGDLRGAEADLDAAVRLAPEYELARAWRGSVRRRLGRPRAARADLELALRLAPTREEIRAELESLRRGPGGGDPAAPPPRRAPRPWTRAARETEARRRRDARLAGGAAARRVL
jgi:tetratricopeptide (TPR) repeat protein